MALAFGNKVISKAYFGEKVVSAIYLGTKKVFPDEEEELPGTGDIRLRIQTTSANQSFPLFYRITTEEGGYVSVDWGDGNKETLTGNTTYQPTHTYATAGEYIVKLTGSKFTEVGGGYASGFFRAAVREILSLKMPKDSTSVSLNNAFYSCANLTGSIPAWDDCIVDAGYTYSGCTGLTGNIPAWGVNITNARSTYNYCIGLTGEIPEWGANITSASETYTGCAGLTGSIPEWGAKITDAYSTYASCTGLTGSIPEWGANITGASYTYQGCTGLTGSIPEWGANITAAYATYDGCRGLTGSIPKWGANITDASYTYKNCSGLTSCSSELLQDPMPSRITEHDDCVTGCVDEIRQHFTPDWGGMKWTEYIPGTGDIRLRIETTNVNQAFPLFHRIYTEEGGYVSIDWGDGNKETLTGKTLYRPTHVYATAGEYTVKLTGSKFTGVTGSVEDTYNDFRTAIREILSLKMPTDSTSVSLSIAFRGCMGLTGAVPTWDDCIVKADLTYSACPNLTGSIPEWGVNITDAGGTYAGCSGLTGSIPEWGANITDAGSTYLSCTGLTGSIPEWGANITEADYAYDDCTGLTGSIPEWGANITRATCTYSGCTGLTGNIPAWGANIEFANYTYHSCSGLTGNIPAWGVNITDAVRTYFGCTSLAGCSAELLQDPMPSRITDHTNCVTGCADAIRQHFWTSWGGTKLPGSGDIRLRIQTTSANQSFQLFYQITTKSGGYVSVDWGDGNKETLTGKTTYQPEHTYATAGGYVVKLIGSKFTGVNGAALSSYGFKTAVRKILSLKMPTDSTSVSLDYAFYECYNLTGNIPAWDDCITSAYSTYEGCYDLTGNIPEWGVNITSAYRTYSYCRGLSGNIPEWGANITDASGTYLNCTGLTGSIPAWGASITIAGANDMSCGTYEKCTGLTGSIPSWGAKITTANRTYAGCTGLTGNIPEWGVNITDARHTYGSCSGLTGNIPEWGAKIVDAYGAYSGCTRLTGNIPAWGAELFDVRYTYNSCSRLTGCSDELLQDPMPSSIAYTSNCVTGCRSAIRQHFTVLWGGTKPA